MTEPDHYAALRVENTATYEEIKRAYHTQSRIVHPDKNVQLSEEERRYAEQQFHQINKAWQVLGDHVQRKEYDRVRQEGRNKSRGVVQDDIDIDDMDFDEDTLTYSFPCRCSGLYTITEADLENGREISPCTSCSLKVRVLYELADEDN